jgi:phytoene dehydrogenase-like protein
MARKKVAVIGSGIAGSGIAALLAHSGDYEVDLYEKNGLIGGRFASYTKEGFRLDIGCHMIANCEKGTMGQILDILGQPEAVTKVSSASSRGSVSMFSGRPTPPRKTSPTCLGKTET